VRPLRRLFGQLALADLLQDHSCAMSYGDDRSSDLPSTVSSRLVMNLALYVELNLQQHSHWPRFSMLKYCLKWCQLVKVARLC